MVAVKFARTGTVPNSGLFRKSEPFRKSELAGERSYAATCHA
ncbi:hypothetical protein PSP20601_03774 [Pandoraea sputorum]|nr:hypothetical protein PSP20601_03774 [Pandoraea sputorum]